MMLFCKNKNVKIFKKATFTRNSNVEEGALQNFTRTHEQSSKH